MINVDKEKILIANQFVKEKNYWIEKFSGELEYSSFPNDLDIADNVSVKRKLELNLPDVVSQKLISISGNSDYRLHMLLTTAVTVLVGKYTGNSNIILGSVIYSKENEGKFINTILPIKTELSAGISFKQLLVSIRKIINECIDNQNYPFEKLLLDINAPKRKKGFPLFDVMILLENIQAITNTEDVNANIKFVFKRQQEQIKLFLDYNVNLYSTNFIERLTKNFIKTLRIAVENINIKICDIDMLAEKEKSQILVDFNNTKSDYPKEKTIHQLFEEQVDRVPQNTAVVCGDKKLTYKELNEKVNQLANKLRNEGVKRDSLVGLMAEKSLELIVGILGVLKAGGSYLPIDPKYPKERIEYMLEDSGTNILLTQKRFTANVSFGGEIVCIDDERNYEGSVDNLECINKPEDLAYVIYTSGTTGKPKGAMIEHKNVVRLLFNEKLQFEFNDKDVWTMFHSHCFDFSVWEMYGAILYGGKLVIIPSIAAKDTGAFLKILKEEKVTVLNQTPSAFYRLTEEELKEDEKKLTLKYIIFGGEALKPVMLGEFHEKYPKTKLINMYGITETTVHVTYKEISQKEIEKNISNIGVPIPTLTTYIMDKNMKLQPIGVTGEICVGGDGVGRGYLNRKALTEERFVTNPYKEDERLYRSGDLARMLPNGELEYLGRIDHQVKIRGYRIELGEIESRLLEHEDVKEAVIAVKSEDSGEKYLTTYFTADRQLTIGELKEHLKTNLPEYMIPSYFVQLEKMPLTTNGKINRKALPQPEGFINTGVVYEAPRNETEQKMTELWQDLLKVERIGINDNFFELGGHSLKATVMVARIQKELGVLIALKEIFIYPTIKGLARIIEGQEAEIYKGIIPVELKKYYPVSSIQKRMFIINQFDKDEVVYNMPIITTIEGTLDRERLEKAFEKLVERHDAFRTSFEFQEEEIVQRVHEKTDYKLKYYEQNEEAARKIAEGFIRPFNLSKAPLIRTALIKIEEQKHILMVDMHHIISDGTSIEIIMEEFSKLYYGMELEPLTIQYKDYAVWQNQENIKKQLQKQEEYWLEVFKEEIPVLNLPIDYKRPKILTYEGGSYVMQIDKELTQKINNLSVKNGATLFTILLAIYSIALSKYSGQEDIVIGTVTAGRTKEEVQSVIGVFLNNIAFRCKPQKEKTFEEYLKDLKAEVLQGYENQEYPIEELIEKLDITRDMSRNTLFDVMMILQNYESRTRDIELGEIKLTGYDYDSKVSRYDITLTIFETEEGLILSYEYFTSIFKPETIERLAEHMVKLAEEITANPQQQLKKIEMLTGKEKQQVIKNFNQTKEEYPKDKTVIQMIEEQVEKHPDNIAAEYGNEKLTYHELNQKANQLARKLREKGIKNKSIVGIIVKRSVEMLVTALAVMKAGGAYLAIEPEYPKDRIEYMLNDSEVKILLTQKKLAEEIKFQGETIDVKDQSLYRGDGTNLKNINSLNDLVYMIYTSGTTGKPKGVMVEHKNLLNMAYAWKKDYKLEAFEVRLLQIASMSFDVFPGDITRTLTNGGCMIICPSEVRIDLAALHRMIKDKEINIFETTPALVIPLMEYIYENNLNISCLKILIMGGDSCSVEEFNKLNKRYKNTMRIINNYGVAEATIDSSYYEAQELLKGTGNVSIGKPMQNIRYYILDEDKKPKAVGHYGELYIAGDGVARGYKNKPELTAEKFMTDPFTAGERMYKTGDMARWMQDGNIDFLGRLDNQIKIRGYRIELGEIESSLLGYEGIKEAIVIAMDELGEKYLCAYIMAEKEIDSAEIMKYLRLSLPEYMIPLRYVQLEKLPLTPNGKIDRKVFPKPEGSIKKGVAYEAEGNETEAKLVRIWEELLKLNPIGVNDNFFELGGHSLKATMLVGRIKKVFNMELPLKEIFKTPTIKALSQYIEKNKQQGYIKGTEDMILLKKSSNADRNLFLIHDITCEVSGYREFCSAVNIDINCWGIRAAMNKEYSPENITIEEIAAEYIKNINAVQKQGPYYLGGWSIGGTIAFEIARQLEEKGEEIEKLWIFDTEAPCTVTSTRYLEDKVKVEFTVDEEKAFISSLLPKSTVPETIKRGETIEEIWYETIRYMETYGLDAERIKKFTEEYTGHIVTDIETMELLEIIKYMNKIRSLDRALYMYKPQTVVNAPVNLIKAKESRWLKQEKWKEHTSRHIKIIEIPGNHFTIFKEPNVKEIIRIFESIFIKE